MVSNDARFIIVEGNYLASSESPWVDLRPCFDLIVYLEVPLSELVRRLHCRWEEHGWSREKAERWIETNDLPNIKYTQDTRSGVDILIGSAA